MLEGQCAPPPRGPLREVPIAGQRQLPPRKPADRRSGFAGGVQAPWRPLAPHQMRRALGAPKSVAEPPVNRSIIPNASRLVGVWKLAAPGAWRVDSVVRTPATHRAPLLRRGQCVSIQASLMPRQRFVSRQFPERRGLVEMALSSIYPRFQKIMRFKEPARSGRFPMRED